MGLRGFLLIIWLDKPPFWESNHHRKSAPALFPTSFQGGAFSNSGTIRYMIGIRASADHPPAEIGGRLVA